MAELLLKVGTRGPDPDWQDGDIIVAPNDRRISQLHLENLCHVKKEGFTHNGRRPDGLARTYREKVCQYRFERVSGRTIRRVNLWTDEVEEFSDLPNAKGERIDVPLFVARALNNPKHAIFGTPGAEVWYGGRQDFSSSNLDKVWPMAEDELEMNRTDFTFHPWGSEDLKRHLALKVDDFDDERSAGYVAAEVNELTSATIQRRVSKVNWKELDLGVKFSDIEDAGITVDIRADKSFLRDTVVIAKSAKGV